MPLSDIVNLVISTQLEAIMWTPTPTPPLIYLISAYLEPILDFLAILAYGALPTLRYMSRHPLSLLSLATWRTQLSGATQPWILRMLDIEWGGVKKHILRNARGVVLEIGAGTGETMKYYPRGDQIERIYGVEPSFKKCVILRYEAQKLGMKDKYEVVPSGIENVEGLKKYGIEARSIDTIVCVVPPLLIMRKELILDTLFVQYSGPTKDDWANLSTSQTRRTTHRS